jgi:hypothetical protein
MKNIIAATVAGLVMFFWGFVSWTVLPWHNTDVHSFVDEAAVMQVIVDNAPASGIYYMPSDDADFAEGKPGAMVNVMKNGFPVGLLHMIAHAVIASIIMAYIAIMLLAKTNANSFTDKVKFVTLVGFLIGLSSSFMYWNWFGYPTGYSLVNLVDTVVTWALAGLVIGKMAEV